MRPRTLARRLALQYLYMVDVNGDGEVESAGAFLYQHAPDDEEARRFADELISAVLGDRETIDQHLSAAASNWDLSRIAVVERNALRIGTAELLRGITPVAVALNEAVRAAKTFGGKDSGAFVNGVLDRVRQALQSGGDQNNE